MTLKALLRKIVFAAGLLLLFSVSSAQEPAAADTSVTVKKPVPTFLDSAAVLQKRPDPVLPPERLESLTRMDTSSVQIGSMKQRKQRVAHGVIVSKSPTGAALRSALIPGWGQFYTKNYIKATVFFGVDVGFIYGAIVQHTRYQDALESADRTKTEERRIELEQEANFYRDDRNRLIWWTAGITLLASIDAFVEAHLFDFRIDPELETVPQGDGLKAGLTLTFSL